MSVRVLGSIGASEPVSPAPVWKYEYCHAWNEVIELHYDMAANVVRGGLGVLTDGGSKYVKLHGTPEEMLAVLSTDELLELHWLDNARTLLDQVAQSVLVMVTPEGVE